jgi:hypothetical protein
VLSEVVHLSVRPLCYPAGVVGLGREATKGTLDRQRGAFLADAILKCKVQAQRSAASTRFLVYRQGSAVPFDRLFIAP